MGYPVPGAQNPTPEEIVKTYYFVNSCDWPDLLTQNADFIVFATEPTSVAFAEQALKNDPKSKMLHVDEFLWR